jgi:hypothetical protein
MAAETRDGAKLCIYFQQGRCHKAEMCPFSHNLSQAHEACSEGIDTDDIMGTSLSLVPAFSFSTTPALAGIGISRQTPVESSEEPVAAPIVGSKRSKMDAIIPTAAEVDGGIPDCDDRPAILTRKKPRVSNFPSLAFEGELVASALMPAYLARRCHFHPWHRVER